MLCNNRSHVSECCYLSYYPVSPRLVVVSHNNLKEFQITDAQCKQGMTLTSLDLVLTVTVLEMAVQANGDRSSASAAFEG